MLQLDNQTKFYKGKVRDVYTIKDTMLAMVVTDRISAFDVVLPKPIPYKGQVLNQIAAIALEATKDILPNWVLDVPLPNATIGYNCDPFQVEMVIRGYLTGHAWRTYKTGNRTLCGIAMPEGMKENDPFPEPIITPTTKAHEGHDQDISREDIISNGLVDEDVYKKLEHYTRALFARGQQQAAENGLILVDTKYEFGKLADIIYLIDEIHTPDSSRYFYKEGYQERQQNGASQKQLSKEFVREWLMENDFQGKEGQQIPEMNDQVVNSISDRYIELFEKFTGRQFVKKNVTEMEMTEVLNQSLKAHS